MTEQEFLDRISKQKASRVLDVATGHGGFLFALEQWFPHADEYIGIDVMPKAIEHAQPHLNEKPKFRVELADAHSMPFPDSSFDVVAICNSMHHLETPELALIEMKRVLRSGGLMIVYEMIANDLSETQDTHRFFHHWWAKLDAALGISHRPTYSQEELLKLMHSLHLHDIDTYLEIDIENDPHEAEGKKMFAESIPQYLERARELPHYEEICREAEELKQRLEEIGVHRATQLMIIGTKR